MSLPTADSSSDNNKNLAAAAAAARNRRLAHQRDLIFRTTLVFWIEREKLLHNFTGLKLALLMKEDALLRLKRCGEHGAVGCSKPMGSMGDGRVRVSMGHFLPARFNCSSSMM
jgi:hypothetical protein